MDAGGSERLEQDSERGDEGDGSGRSEEVARWDDEFEEDQEDCGEHEGESDGPKRHVGEGVEGEQCEQRSDATGKDRPGSIAFEVEEQDSGEEGEEGGVRTLLKGEDEVGHWKL
jgi:hypothetical protein